MNSILGIANGVTNRNLAVIIGGERPVGLDTQSAALHIGLGLGVESVEVNLFCPNATVGFRWRKYNIWRRGEFAWKLANPMTLCPHPIRHNNVTVARM